MQLDEARQRAHAAARDSEHAWYVIQVDDDYRVISQTELDALPGHAHSVVYGAQPGKPKAESAAA